MLERFHKEPPENDEDGLRAARPTSSRPAGGAPASARPTTSCSSATAPARRCGSTGSASAVAEGEPVWLERKFDFKVGEHHVRGRVDRVDRLPDGDYELIDYKTGERRTEAELENDLQLALYRLAAREAWEIEASTGSYYYVLDADKVAAPTKPDDAERVERTVLQVGEGILSQDFEPRPSPSVCSWCDYRLICPAAES